MSIGSPCPADGLYPRAVSAPTQFMVGSDETVRIEPVPLHLGRRELDSDPAQVHESGWEGERERLTVHLALQRRGPDGCSLHVQLPLAEGRYPPGRSIHVCFPTLASSTELSEAKIN